MDRTHHGLVIALFCANLVAFLAYARGALVTNLFSLLLMERYVLAIHHIITHEEHFGYSFLTVVIL